MAAVKLVAAVSAAIEVMLVVFRGLDVGSGIYGDGEARVSWG